MSIPEPLPIDIEVEDKPIIKVLGVGGGGCNAVNYMYKLGIHGVTFIVCNTDKQSLGTSLVPKKLQLGVEGLGAGGKPEVSKKHAEDSIEVIKQALDDGTKMVFITAGMGGGTGTGAAPVVARVAKDMGILTVGIVTIPFSFEGPKRIENAMVGVKNMADSVDALLVINNDTLTEDDYGDLDIKEAFGKADNVLAQAAKSIAEIITKPGYINIDFADVESALKNGRVAIMNVGEAEGENRVINALNNALNSPLANNVDISGASRILMQITCKGMKGSELQQITKFKEEIGGGHIEVSMGLSFDDDMGDKINIILIATGYELEQLPGFIPTNDEEITKATQAAYSHHIETKTNFRPSQTDNPKTSAIIDLYDDVDKDDVEETPTWMRENIIVE